MNRDKRTAIFSTLRDAGTRRRTTELDYDSPFELLVAVILSAQATDIGVNKATSKAVSRSPTRPRPSFDARRVEGLNALHPHDRSVITAKAKERHCNTCQAS